jgi:hypothetical protein
VTGIALLFTLYTHIYIQYVAVNISCYVIVVMQHSVFTSISAVCFEFLPDREMIIRKHSLVSNLLRSFAHGDTNLFPLQPELLLASRA